MVVRVEGKGTKISWRQSALRAVAGSGGINRPKGKLFGRGVTYQSVSARKRAHVYVYIHTYVYAVLSDGTRGCCGLIYRLSLPWKPRRDRLARHPHIRVDSGLLYSPPHHARSLARAFILSFSHPCCIRITPSLTLPRFSPSFSSPHPLHHLAFSPSSYLHLSLSAALYPPFTLSLSLSLFS